MSFEDEVNLSLEKLANSVQVQGPIRTANHITYVVTGLADNDDQLTSLCWCILGFLIRAISIDFAIDSSIGEGERAAQNILQSLRKRLKIEEDLTDEQKSRNRDPLLQELVAHLLLAIHHRNNALPDWLAEVQSLHPPHLNPHDSGLDLIAIGVEDERPFTIIGEVKAYETDPLGGFNQACVKFSQVRRGEYNDEIRPAMVSLSSRTHFSKDDLAANIWVNEGRFGAIVGHDGDHGFNVNRACEGGEVSKQDPERLFFITSPYRSMKVLFDNIAGELCRLARTLGDYDV